MAAVSAGLLAALVTTVPATAATSAAGVSESLVASEIEFRNALSFPADPAFVRSLHESGADVDRSTGFLLTPAEAAELAAREDALADAATALRLAPAALVGGVHLDHANGGRVVVNVVGDAPVLVAAVRAAMTSPERLHVAHVAHSRQSLDRLHERVADEALRPHESFALPLISTDIVRNVVEVGVSGDLDAARIHLAAAFPGAPIVLTQDVVAVPTAEKENVTNAPPLRGGQEIDTAEGRCTSAFVGYNVVRLDAAIFTYDYFLVTAGHCALANTAFTQVAFPIGLMTTTTYSTGIDAGMIAMPAAAKSNDVWIGGAELFAYKHIQYVEAGGAIGDQVGATVYQAGIKSTYRGGTIVSLNNTFTYPPIGPYGATQVRKLRRATQPSIPGDSGASVFNNNLAKGIASGAATVVSTGDVDILYTHISTAMPSLGLQYLKTTPAGSTP